MAQDLLNSSKDDALTGFEIVVGLEVHCELLTQTKLFCGCRNNFGDEPNTNICPVCLGLPGSLPVLNKRAVELAMKIGKALNCEILPSSFHRKNYFYPDMPKDFQISQYDQPINANGYLELPDKSKVGVVRAHIEEDTGKSLHIGGSGRIAEASKSLVDYNRAGVPLVEIVSAPEIRSSEQAKAYVQELRYILVATGASDGRMEEGSLRVDANVSVRPVGSKEFGTRCEIKNLNSLRSLTQAIEYEARRQAGLIRDGKKVTQETRHYNEVTNATSSMRSKEEANDYRYFPEPDLVPLVPDASWIEEITSDIQSLLPATKRRNLSSLIGEEYQDQISLLVEIGLDELVLDSVKAGADAKLALNRVINEAAREPEKASRLAVKDFVDLINMESSNKLSATQSKVVLQEMLTSSDHPAEIAKRLGFEQMDQDSLQDNVRGVIEANQAEWGRYLAGDEKVLQFLLGQVMRSTKGRANGKEVMEIIGRLKSN
ncbi:MAG: Asp-tRNA(Asn)/Glu-tRNA(Gln) amidotransferase subunit GatB [Firmicutes bacterium]|nr:Asp-tRNA(Asn)/Glu-tRNA(Gln) amidotransferase subunit GatB [Bacillota bacterium]